jgi:hypothetical protein
MAEPKIPPDLEVDVNENCEKKIEPILGGIDKEIVISHYKEAEAFCHCLVTVSEKGTL